MNDARRITPTWDEVDLCLDADLGPEDDSGHQRASKRSPVVRVVEYSPYPRRDASQHLEVGFTANESHSGLCMMTRQTHAVGEPLRISVREVNGEARLEAIARVAWCNPDAGDRVAVGLEFIEVRSGAAQNA